MEAKNSNSNNKPLLKWIALIVLILVLVAAAFVGGQLLNGRVNPLGAEDEPGNDSSEPREIQVIPAAELPSLPPDGSGTFLRRQDNSIFLGVGNDTGVSSSDSESPAVGESPNNAGAVLEVVVTSETAIYQEVPDQLQQSVPDEIQLEVVAGTLEDIGATSFIWVWGQKTGDRIIADVLLYSLPVIKPSTIP